MDWASSNAEAKIKFIIKGQVYNGYLMLLLTIPVTTLRDILFTVACKSCCLPVGVCLTSSLRLPRSLARFQCCNKRINLERQKKN